MFLIQACFKNLPGDQAFYFKFYINFCQDMKLNWLILQDYSQKISFIHCNFLHYICMVNNKIMFCCLAKMTRQKDQKHIFNFVWQVT